MTEAPVQARVGRAQLARLRNDLSERDGLILRFLSQQRYATTVHVRRMFFHTHATSGAATRATIRVLDRLFSRRLITRLERKVGGHTRGSAAYIWHLDAAGERLTRKKNGPRRRYDDPALPFLEHSLQITETVTLLHEISREGEPKVSRLQVEAQAWRSFHERPAVVRILKPDLFVTLSTAEYDDHWYIEIDRGTESLPVLLTKCRTYATYRHTGHAQAEHGVFPRVLWVLPSQHRVERLHAAIASDPYLPSRLFTVITPTHLVETLRDPPDP